MKSVAAIMLSFFFRWHYFTTSYFIIPLLGLPLVAQCLYFYLGMGYAI